LPGICLAHPQTAVLAHLQDENFGGARKAADISGMFCCWRCHSAYDLHSTGLDDLTLLRLVFRAYQRTMRRLVLRGIIVVPLDPERLSSDKPVKPRPPKGERRAVPKGPKLESRSTFPPKGTRKFPSRAKEHA